MKHRANMALVFGVQEPADDFFIYSEPGGKTHFARTAAEPVVVELSGSGPTDTVYFDAANDPSQHRQQAALQARD